MRRWTRSWTAVGAVAMVLLGGVAAVQQQTRPALDADALADRIGLSEEVRAEVTPRIEELSRLLARGPHMDAEGQAVMARLHQLQGEILERLTPEQRDVYRAAIREAGGYGHRSGHMGPASARGGWHMGSPGMMGSGHGPGMHGAAPSAYGCWLDGGAPSAPSGS